MDEIILLDNIRTQRYNMYEISRLLKVEVEYIQTICQKYHLGKEVNGVITFIKGNKRSDEDVSILQMYLEHPNIEQEVIDYIDKNQPISLYRLKEDLGLSREKVWKVIDEITVRDCKLMEDKIRKKDLLFYGEKGEKLLMEAEGEE